MLKKLTMAINKIVTRKIFKVRKLKFNLENFEKKENGVVFSVNTTEKGVIKDNFLSSLSESRLTRLILKGMNVVIVDFSTITTFNKKQLSDFEKLTSKLFTIGGLIVDGENFSPLGRSASEARNNEVIFIKSDSNTVLMKIISKLMQVSLDEATKGFDMNSSEKTFLSKFTSRVLMGGSSSLDTGFVINNKYVVVDDKEVEINIENRVQVVTDSKSQKPFVIKIIKDGIKISKKLLKHNTSDGQGVISPIAMAKVASGIGLITKYDFTFFLKFYGKNVKQHNERVNHIFSLLPGVIQVRVGGVKGLLVMLDKSEWDLSTSNVLVGEYDKNTQIVFTKSMWKHNVDNTQKLKLEFLSSNKKKAEYGTFNSQFFNGLDLSTELTETLVNESLDFIKDVLVDAKSAKAFLGIFFNVDSNVDVEKDNKTMVSNIFRLLQSNPKSITDLKVQQFLREKVLLKLKSMKYGRLKVKGNSYLVITDPIAIFGNKVIASRSCHFNGIEQKVGLFRNPKIHQSEQYIAQTKNYEKYSYLKNVIILAADSVALPALGGADTDGDKLFVVTDTRIVSEMKQSKVLVTRPSNDSGQKKQLTLENYLEFLGSELLIEDMIGRITNNAAMLLDQLNASIRNKKSILAVRKLNNKLLVLSQKQGDEIDKVKTGMKVTLSDEQTANHSPTWFANQFLYKKFKYDAVDAIFEEKYRKRYSKDLDAFQKSYNLESIYKSNTSMGTIYNMVSTYEVSLKTEMSNETDRQISFKEDFLEDLVSYFTESDIKLVNNGLIDVIDNKVKKLCATYGTELYRLRKLELDDEGSKALRNEIFDKSEVDFKRATSDLSSFATLYIAYSATFNGNGKGISYYSIVAFNELLEYYNASNHNSHRRIMVKVPSGTKEVEIENGILSIDNVPFSNYDSSLVTDKRRVITAYTVNNETFIDLRISKSANRKLVTTSPLSISVVGLKFGAFESTELAHLLSISDDLVVKLELKEIKNKNYKKEVLGVTLNGSPLGIISSDSISEIQKFSEEEFSINSFIISKNFKTLILELKIIPEVIEDKPMYSQDFSFGDSFQDEEQEEYIEMDYTDVPDFI